MNKEKFNKKCQELSEYENEILHLVNCSIEDKNRNLNEIGLKCCAFLIWNYYGEEEIFLERPEMKENYKCDIVSKICKMEDDLLDFELDTINVIFPLTILSKGIIIRIFQFNKLAMDGFFERMEEAYQDITDVGYEKMLLTLAQ